MRFGQTAKNLFDRIKILLAQMDLAQHQDAVCRKIVRRKRLFVEPLKCGGIALVLYDDAKQHGARIGVLFVAQHADGGFDVFLCFRDARPRRRLSSRSGKAKACGKKTFRVNNCAAQGCAARRSQENGPAESGRRRSRALLA